MPITIDKYTGFYLITTRNTGSYEELKKRMDTYELRCVHLPPSDQFLPTPAMIWLQPYWPYPSVQYNDEIRRLRAFLVSIGYDITSHTKQEIPDIKGENHT